MKNIRKNTCMTYAMLPDDLLDQVSGGAGTLNVDPEVKYLEFKQAWDDLGFTQHGWSVQLRNGMCDQWESEGFPGTASQWLSKYKQW